MEPRDKNVVKPIMSEEFSSLLNVTNFSFLKDVDAIAVGVSGGADSMALVCLLGRWGEEHGVSIHALSVDHGLRPEAASEVRQVAKILSSKPAVRHAILTWDKPIDKCVQEEARKARYTLMAEYCAAQEISTLFLAHHQDDQAETFLFRLAKGSGLDGLAGMQPVSHYNDNLVLCRPFLALSKERLIATCDAVGVSFIEDPSNQNDKFARVRLRRAREILEGEGLSNKRLAVTAERLSRASIGLDEVASRVLCIAAKEKNTKLIVFKFSELVLWPEEIVLRVILKSIGFLGAEKIYQPRMEKVESLVNELISSKPFRKRTLGGVVFERDDGRDEIILSKEVL